MSETITIDNEEYIPLDYLFKKVCTIRELIRKKENTDYIFAKFINNKCYYKLKMKK